MGTGQARQSLAKNMRVHFVSAGFKGQSLGSGEGLLMCVYWVWLGVRERTLVF